MKIRNGFVSNSSSSSFVVTGDTTTAQVAALMMYEIQVDWEDSPWYEKDGLPPKFADALEWLHDSVEYNDPIMIPWSTNYETFIWRGKDNICVDTCHNHSWDLVGGISVREDSFYDEVYRHSFLDLSDMQHKTKREYQAEYNARFEDENS